MILICDKCGNLDAIPYEGVCEKCLCEIAKEREIYTILVNYSSLALPMLCDNYNDKNKTN